MIRVQNPPVAGRDGTLRGQEKDPILRSDDLRDDISKSTTDVVTSHA